MQLTIHERDITSELCRQCGACCRILLTLENTDRRYRTFLRQTGFALNTPRREGDTDCCDETHSVQVDTGYCRHLAREEREGTVHCACNLYESPEFPQMCAEFNCVSWAKARNQYKPDNALLVAAQAAYDRMRSAGAVIRIVNGKIIE